MKKILTVSVASVAAAALLFSIGCSKSGSSGDPGEALMGHMKAIFKILKDNTDDCDAAVEKVTAYTEENKAELEALGKKLKEMEKEMSEEEKKKYEEKMKKMAEGMVKESMAAMMEFGKKCPTQMKEISEAMQFMNELK